MLLVVDVGNTHTVLGLYDGQTLVRHFRVASDRNRTEDELHVMLVNLVRLAGVEPKQVGASILASVVPALTEVLVRAMPLG
jgi:type III pantothenate kinase